MHCMCVSLPTDLQSLLYLQKCYMHIYLFMEIRSENAGYQPTEFQIHNEIILFIIFYAKSAP